MVFTASHGGPIPESRRNAGVVVKKEIVVKLEEPAAAEPIVSFRNDSLAFRIREQLSNPNAHAQVSTSSLWPVHEGLADDPLSFLRDEPLTPLGGGPSSEPEREEQAVLAYLPGAPSGEHVRQGRSAVEPGVARGEQQTQRGVLVYLPGAPSGEHVREGEPAPPQPSVARGEQQTQEEVGTTPVGQSRRSNKPRLSALIEHRVFVERDVLKYKDIPCYVTSHSKTVHQRLKIDVDEVPGLLVNLRQLNQSTRGPAEGDASGGRSQPGGAPDGLCLEGPNQPAQPPRPWEKFTYFPNAEDPSHIICSVSHFKLIALWAVGGFSSGHNWTSDLHGYDDKDFVVTTMNGEPLPVPIPLRAIRDEFAKMVDWDFQRGSCGCNPPHESGATTLIRLVSTPGLRKDRDDDEAREVNTFAPERESLGPIDYAELPPLEFDVEEFNERVRSEPFLEHLGLQPSRTKKKPPAPSKTPDLGSVKLSSIEDVENFLEELLPDGVPRAKGKPRTKARQRINYDSIMTDDTVLAKWTRRFQNVTDVLSLYKDWVVVKKSFLWMAILIEQDWYLLSKLAAEAMLQICKRNQGHRRKVLQFGLLKEIISKVHERASKKRKRANARAIDTLWVRLHRTWRS